MIILKVVVIAFFLCFSLLMHAQQEDIITDRPDATESAAVVPKKHLQVESGFYYEKSTYNIFILGDIEENYFDYISSLFRYGLLDILELRLQIGYSGLHQSQLFLIPEEDTTGFSPLVVGAKIALLKEKGIIPQTGLIYHATIPDIGLFAPDKLYSEVRLAFANTLTDDLGLGYNIGVVFPDFDNLEFFYTVALGYDIGSGFGVFIENFGETYNKDWEISFDGGFTYLIRPNIQLDAFAGFPVSDVPTNYFFGAGISFRIPD